MIKKTIILWFFSLLAGLNTAQAHDAESILNAQAPLIVCADEPCFIAQAQQQFRLPESQLIDFFQQVNKKESIVRAINRPGTSRPWYEFARNNASFDRIQQGRKFFRQNNALLNKIAQEYQVDPAIIVAILGIETRYGRHSGSFRVGDALYTLSFFYPQRAEFFQQELQQFLIFSQELHRNPLSFTGSYAGAMGMPQFMPSSYRKWAVDYDKDGFADIWHSPSDIIASVANYLVAHGWQANGAISVPVALMPTPEIERIIDEKTALNYRVQDFRRMGVIVPAEISDQEPAILYALESRPGEFDYYLGLNNFYSIWHYNHSRMYVHAVQQIAQGIHSGSL